MVNKVATNEEQLLAILSAERDPDQHGPIAVAVLLSFAGNRMLIATYYSGSREPAVSTREATLDPEKLRPMVQQLLTGDAPFVTKQGMDDQYCKLYWQLIESPRD